MSVRHIHSTIEDTLFLLEPVTATSVSTTGFVLNLIPGYVYDLPRGLECKPGLARINPTCNTERWSKVQWDSMFFRGIVGGAVCMSEGYHVTFDYPSNSISVADSSEECSVFIPFPTDTSTTPDALFDFAIVTDSRGRCINFADSVHIAGRKINLLCPGDQFPVSTSRDVAVLQTNGLNEIIFVHRAEFKDGVLKTLDNGAIYHGSIVTEIQNPISLVKKESSASKATSGSRAAIGDIAKRISSNVATDLMQCNMRDVVLREQVMKALTTLCDPKATPARIEHEGFGDSRRSTAHYNGFKVPMGPENELRIRFVEGTVGNKGPDTIDMVHRLVREFFELDLTYNKDQLKVDVWANGSLVIDVILKSA